MKRDMDLIRLILLKIEDEYKTDDIIEMKIDDYDRDTIIDPPTINCVL